MNYYVLFLMFYSAFAYVKITSPKELTNIFEGIFSLIV